ncbi:MAG: AAA family ATPase, partial [Anaerolineae bacterium]|nr:AAA family ATPase [Anaerolineae bacterium]
MEKREGQDFDEHQLKAVEKILSSKVSFIWGPPGTGKTKTLGLTVAALVASSESVLIVAQSNIAVDMAMLNIAQNLESSQLYREGGILRYGVTYLSKLNDFPLLSARYVVKQRNHHLIEKIESLEKQRRELIRRSRKESLSVSEKERIDKEIMRVKADSAPLFTELKEKEK